MLEYSDILLAIWHGEPQFRIGNTSVMVDATIDLEMPVIWIHTTQNIPPALWYYNEGDSHAVLRVRRIDSRKASSH